MGKRHSVACRFTIATNWNLWALTSRGANANGMVSPVAFPAGETSQVAACLHAPDARTGVDSFSFGSPPNACDQPRMPRGFGSRG